MNDIVLSDNKATIWYKNEYFGEYTERHEGFVIVNSGTPLDNAWYPSIGRVEEAVKRHHNDNRIPD